MQVSVGHSGAPGRSRPSGRLITPTLREPRRSEIHILDNPLARAHQELSAEVERELHDLLDGEELGRLEVRFRVCRDDEEGMRFLCKIEGIPPADPDVQNAQWRWWSPLMSGADDFREALGDALEIRRQRMATRASA